MSDLVVPAKTVFDQRRAADPTASAWVSANAGSGKTKVLADRVLRLLLNGADPARVLCLTFTKAAAANMAIRVFDKLAEWVRLDDEALAAALTGLDGTRPAAPKLSAARRLFARAVETPGGLKIETIHAFCERLLHLFPFEANVPARFEVLDEAASAELLERARQEVMVETALGGDARLAEALHRLAEETSDGGLDEAVRAALCERELLRDCTNDPAGIATIVAALARAFGLAPGETVETIERAMLDDGVPPEEWPSIAAALLAGSKRDQSRGRALAAAAAADGPEERLARYRSVFLTREGEPLSDKSFLTKSVPPDVAERLKAERERLARLAVRRKAAAAVRRTEALLTLAQAIFARLETLKSARGALDFEDLIGRTVALFSRAHAAWVLYKLDAGIDHILVDEAQDTSPAQWAILKAIAEEFTAGEGAALGRRTLFAVGDPKQSIYGFQGAAPQEFEGSGRHFGRKLADAGQRFEAVSLTLSFRSAPEVLSAVDAVFAEPAHFRGLSFDDAVGKTVHQSARPTAPGIVEIWETERPADTPEPEAWVLPIDEPETSAPPVRLARRIARTVRRWITLGEENGGPVSAGDVLILVRKRGALYEAVIRALKQAGVAVAGADRLRLAEHIAVRDLVAAGRAALLPDDDLTLAAALKSPLVGLTDEDLIRIAAERPDRQSLAAALETAAESDLAAAAAQAIVDNWRRLSQSHGPFGFYATLLGPSGGRRELVSRLGAEAGDAIDEFLALALDFERRKTPSLAAFLSEFSGTAREVKRDMDAALDEVRVMTVHGAKGLEARFVILADGCDAPNGRQDPKLVPIPAKAQGRIFEVPAWSPKRDLDPPAVAAGREILRAKALEEHNRLLYVAMTRAKDRLVVASCTNLGRDRDGAFKPLPEFAWAAMIRRGLEAAAPGLVEETAADGTRLWRWGDPAKDPMRGAAEPLPVEPPEPPPAWLMRALPPESERQPPLRPSSALAAADGRPRPGEAPFAPEARLVGELVHALIEHLPALPEPARAEAAESFIAARAPRLDASVRARIAADALRIIGLPSLADLFGPAARAEVPIAGSLPLPGSAEPVPVSGQIDRLAITDEAVLVADFKTTARPPEHLAGIADSHLAQLAIYRALIAELYRDRPVRAFLVYTSGPKVMEIPASKLEAALAAVAADASP